MWKKQVSRIILIIWSTAALACFGKPAAGQGDDPPSRVARLSYAQGSISFEPAGAEEWVVPGINRPITIGDRIWADNDGRAELQLDGSVIRMSNNTGFSFLNLNDNVTQIQLTAGTILMRVRRLDRNETYEIDTPNLAFSVLRPGVYRVSVNENGDETALSVRSGEGEVTGGGASYNVHANDSYDFSGTDQLYANREPRGEDQFENWAATRDRRWASARSATYVSEDVIGYEDLDDYGTWREVPDYGGVWFPRVETADWAPYHYGHWCYIEPWGYSWVDDEPWGFAPFHYGRWVHYEGLWGWVPAPRQVERTEYVRPVYAPALVAWVGGEAVGASVAWFALGPREVYVPSYPVSRSYVDRVNVTNTTVNTTVINNYYNTTVVNRNTNVTNVKYVNREVPGAIAATTPQAFTGAQPVARNQVNAGAVASGPVRALAPSVAPVRQTVLGSAPARTRPPAAVQTRTVVAKSTPPPPAPRVDQRLAAVQRNGGKPLSIAQMRQIAPAEPAQPHPAVRVVSAAKPSATPPPAPPNRAAQPANPAPARPAPNGPATKPPSATPPPNRPADRPSNATPPPARPNPPAPGATQPNRPAEHSPANPPQPAHPAESLPERAPAHPATHNPPTQPPPRNDRPSTAAPVHPNEQPSPARTTPPPSNNPAINQQQQKEQEQLRARQEQERQRLQQRQEQDHAKAAQQQANQAQQQQMEQRHQQETQKLQQKHAQEQQQQKQQQERQAQEKKKQPPPEPKH